MRRVVDLFALWIVLASVSALAWPESFAWFELGWIQPMLGVIMLGMGLTLTWDDFARVGRVPRAILLGVGLQFVVMPGLGYVSGYAFQLSAPLAVGLVLVASCPGGTASNVIAYIAGADVALSVSMTTLSTLLAVGTTPLLTSLLAGSRVALDAWLLLLGTIKVVLLPVTVGLLLRTFLPGLTRRLLPVAPVLAVVCIVLIVAGIVSHMQPTIVDSAPRLILAVASVHLGGAALGYGLGRALGAGGEQVARTISIEVGMQNAGLGIALARGGAFANPMVAVPSVFSAVCSCLLGSALAAWWSRTPTGTAQNATALAAERSRRSSQLAR